MKTQNTNNKAQKTSVHMSVIHAEINEHKVDIDKSVFQKTEAEKLNLKEMKLPSNLAKGITENK
jgi:hypothetical protein